MPVVAGVPEKSGLVKGGRSITIFQIWNEHMAYLLQGKLLLRSHACHGVDHGGCQGGAGHHRVVGHRRHWRLRQRRLAVVRRLLVPLRCCRVRHVWDRVLGGELEVGVHLLQLLQLVLEEADEALEVAAVSSGAVKTVDKVLLLVLANKEHSEHLNKYK